MKRFTRTCAAALAAVSLAGPAAADCLNLSKVIPPGPYGGGTYQLDRNTTIMIAPTAFWGPPGPSPTPNFNMIEMRPVDCFGEPEALQLNNAAIAVHILQRQPDAKIVNLNFCDFGGYENVSAQLSTPPEYIGEIGGVTTPMKDPFGDPVDVSVRLSGGEGKLVFEQPGGSVRVMVVGGQEFFVNAICVN